MTERGRRSDWMERAIAGRSMPSEQIANRPMTDLERIVLTRLLDEWYASARYLPPTGVHDLVELFRVPESEVRRQLEIYRKRQSRERARAKREPLTEVEQWKRSMDF